MADKRNWAFHRVATALTKRLTDDFDVDIEFSQEQPEIDADRYDLIYAFFWGERWHRQFVRQRSKIVKEIASHRWEFNRPYGPTTAAGAVRRHMWDAYALVPISPLLYDCFRSEHPRLYQYRLGAELDEFFPTEERAAGPLRFGWAGNPNDPAKNMDAVREACHRTGVELNIASARPLEEMNAYYNEIDVLVIGSLHEGQPTPLLEAMACGRYIISTRVGVAEELIRDRDAGLLIEKDAGSIAEALAEVRDRGDEIRDVSAKNRTFIAENRTWDHAAEQFGAMLHDVLETRESVPDKRISLLRDTIDRFRIKMAGPHPR